MPGARIESSERVTLRTPEREDIPVLQRAYANAELRYPLGTPLKNQEQVEDLTGVESEDQFLVCLDGEDAGPSHPDEDGVKSLGSSTGPLTVLWSVSIAYGVYRGLSKALTPTVLG